MIKFHVFLFFFVISSFCQATDLKPWFGKEYELELRACALYQNYRSLAIPGRHHRHRHRSRDFEWRSSSRNENDGFATFSATYPFMRYCCEFEATVARTHHQNYRWDNFRFTGRCQFLDETEGACVSGVAGLTLTQPFSRALHDASSFHHGHINGEATISIGKEYKHHGLDEYTFEPYENDYQYRWWNVVGVGSSDIGSPWAREYAAFEYRLNEHQFRAFAEVLWGTGSKDLFLPCFNGYGDIHHRSVDIGFRYSYDLECWGTLVLQYSRRVYALNFPANANLVLFEYYLPFGTQFTCIY